MYEYPKKFHNFATDENHLSLLSFLNAFNPKPYNDQGIMIKVSFDSKEYARVILRKDSRKIDYPSRYRFIEFENNLKKAIELF